MENNEEMTAYFEAMIENLCDLDEYFEDENSMDNIASYINKMSILAYDYQCTLNLPLYRARYAEPFDNTDINQFGYIHNLDLIKIFRYNKVREAVLYTATDPMVAFKEIKQSGKPDSFYISVWMPKDDKTVFKLALNINGNGVEDNSNAGKFNQILKNNTGAGSAQYQYLSELGRILERPGTDYRFSSIIASKLLLNHNALMTTSLKSAGRELNVTFNQKTADSLLELKYVYHCNVPNNDTQVFDIIDIGLPEGDHIRWYDWEVDYNTILADSDCCVHIDMPIFLEDIKTGRNFSKILMVPNVNKTPFVTHDGTVDYKDMLVHVHYRIRLIEK